MILDTCFLIDLQRELRKGTSGRATGFLGANADTVFSISVVSATEFLEGFDDVALGERLLGMYKQIDVDTSIAGHAARIRRQLRIAGNLIGDFDILIAATAVSMNTPLVTRNLDDFRRIEGLELVSY